MTPFSRITSPACPLYRPDIDTDQIIPRQFLTRISASGYGDGLLYHWRVRDDGTEDPDCPLNNPAWKDARILIAGPNFGCGSSREHAVWALRDFGFRVVIAPSFSDIFRNNCTGGGLLAVSLPADDVQALVSRVLQAPELPISVDLVAQSVAYDNVALTFDMDPVAREIILSGRDQINATLEHRAAIEDYERQRPGWLERDIR